MPTVRLKAFSSRCDFTAVVPITFSRRLGWSVVQSELKISLKNLQSHITTFSSHNVKPPQSLIKFIVEQIIKVVISKNLKKFVPNELGDYLINVQKDNASNDVTGVFQIIGPQINDLEINLTGTSESAERARKLLNLTQLEAGVLQRFGEEVLKFKSGVSEEHSCDLSTLASFVNFTNLVAQDDVYGDCFMRLFERAFRLFSADDGIGSGIVTKQLFDHAVALAKNPINVSVDVDRFKINLDLQNLFKALSNLVIRSGDQLDWHVRKRRASKKTTEFNPIRSRRAPTIWRGSTQVQEWC